MIKDMSNEGHVESNKVKDRRGPHTKVKFETSKEYEDKLER